MMQQPAGTPSQVYYKRNDFFTVLVWLSVLGSISGIVHQLFFLIVRPYGIWNLVVSIFYLTWGIKILRQKDFFFTGDLTKKCSPWLILAGLSLVFAVLMSIVLHPIVGVVHASQSIFFVLIFLCYRYWSFFRPWKQVQQMPVYTVQQPVMMASPVMMGQPSPMMMAQSSPMMMQQPSPVMMQHASPVAMYPTQQYQ